jgi:hypothetical protein
VPVHRLNGVREAVERGATGPELALAATAFAPAVERRCPTNGESPATVSTVPGVAPE